jgi:hypothetical protein
VDAANAAPRSTLTLADCLFLQALARRHGGVEFARGASDAPVSHIVYRPAGGADAPGSVRGSTGRPLSLSLRHPSAAAFTRPGDRTNPLRTWYCARIKWEPADAPQAAASASAGSAGSVGGAAASGAAAGSPGMSLARSFSLGLSFGGKGKDKAEQTPAAGSEGDAAAGSAGGMVCYAYWYEPCLLPSSQLSAADREHGVQRLGMCLRRRPIEMLAGVAPPGTYTAPFVPGMRIETRAFGGVWCPSDVVYADRARVMVHVIRPKGDPGWSAAKPKELAAFGKGATRLQARRVASAAEITSAAASTVASITGSVLGLFSAPQTTHGSAPTDSRRHSHGHHHHGHGGGGGGAAGDRKSVPKPLGRRPARAAGSLVKPKDEHKDHGHAGAGEATAAAGAGHAAVPPAAPGQSAPHSRADRIAGMGGRQKPAEDAPSASRGAARPASVSRRSAVFRLVPQPPPSFPALDMDAGNGLSVVLDAVPSSLWMFSVARSGHYCSTTISSTAIHEWGGPEVHGGSGARASAGPGSTAVTLPTATAGAAATAATVGLTAHSHGNEAAGSSLARRSVRITAAFGFGGAAASSAGAGNGGGGAAGADTKSAVSAAVASTLQAAQAGTLQFPNGSGAGGNNRLSRRLF